MKIVGFSFLRRDNTNQLTFVYLKRNIVKQDVFRQKVKRKENEERQKGRENRPLQ